MEPSATVTVNLIGEEYIGWFDDWWEQYSHPNWAVAYESHQVKVILPQSNIDAFIGQLLISTHLDSCWTYIVFPSLIGGGLYKVIPHPWHDRPIQPQAQLQRIGRYIYYPWRNGRYTAQHFRQPS